MNYYFLTFEILMFILFIISFLHAKQKGVLFILKLFAALIFGLLLEWATIQQLHAYVYGKFPIMIAGEVPLGIGIGWAVIIYSAGVFTDATNIKPWMRPIMDGVLALNIDLSMDLIAIRLGMWNWGIPMDEDFFGVRWGNFWAWFWVVFFFSASFRYFSKKRSLILQFFSPILAIIIGVAGVLFTNFFIKTIIPISLYKWTVMFTVLFFTGFVLYQRPKILSSKQVPFVALIVPLFFHVYFILTGIISGEIIKPIYILYITIFMALISVYLHKKTLKKFMKIKNFK